MVTPERLEDRRINNRRCRVNGRFVGRMGETAYQWFDSLRGAEFKSRSS
jgi:hypothetical protein